MITLVVGFLVGTTLASYLMLVGNRNASTMRDTAWNSAIPVLEAGIEEGLTHLHLDSDPTANNWTATQLNGQAAYWKRRDLPDGSYYYVTNANITSPQPLIYSAGFVHAPLKDDEFVSRLVRVTATNPPSGFNAAIAANGSIQLSGNVIVDGFDSKLGFYDPTTNRTAAGTIATDSTQPQAINVGTAHVYGKAITGPGGTVVLTGGSVGDLSQTHGIESGWTDNNMNVQFQPNSPPPPDPNYLTPYTIVSGLSNITYLDSGTYKLSTFNSATKYRPMVVAGNAILLVTGDFTVTGNGPNAGYVYIMPGASLKLYVGGTASISGGGVVNATGLPANFGYYGLTSNTVLTYSGAADFVGSINAPQADVNLSGVPSIYGAVICNTFTCSGDVGVHYDLGLRGGGQLMVTSWREL
jgi:hypothetical protein